jgi:fumarate reductase flavoprotein subunit
LFVVAGPGSRGDHIAFAEQANCSLVGEGWGMMLLAPAFQRLHHWQAGFPPVSRILINPNGRRFMDEDSSYSIVWNHLQKLGGEAWMIFDDHGRANLKPGYASWTPDNVAAEVAAGRILSATDLTDLARLLKVAPEALVATVDRWNATLPHGVDPDFLRHETLQIYGYPTPHPIVQPPFYAVRVVPSQLILTQTGIEIDEWARAIDRFGRPIPGLYAAGEAGGGVLGPHYIGATALANALTMGRRAAIHAAQSA